MFSVILVYFFIPVVIPAIRNEYGCFISVNRNINEPQPLILNKAGTSILEPKIEPDIIEIPEGGKFKLACVGNHLFADGKTYSEIETVTCRSGLFSIQNDLYNFGQITCEYYPENIARYSGFFCGGNYREIEIGFQLPKRFLRLVGICFDPLVQTTLYSKYLLTSSIYGRQHNFSRPSWIEDDFYHFGEDTVNMIYSQKRQLQTINSLLGLDPESKEIVDTSTKHYLARGHLTAKADFIFGIQQQVTFHLVNVAPQWEIFNENNWLAVENDVRNYAIDRNATLEVYTGTYGVMTLPHSKTGEQIEVYLYNEGEEVGLPVPLLYWKAVYNRKTKSGVVVIGVNNPYIDDVSDAIICEDISKSISWGSWSKKDFVNGYIYVCTLEDFAEKVPYFPKLDVRGTLT
ncbi:unnamed protein product [Brassicogethes aeneus]|uniref:DNA/RNA non-specific endonuclease/pyrophosphatase/phosphodiesterase domain-containing protein n=1 Tax=Brassicogethes aeneus TaxID=1431903 RepID=A0A9P0BB10_BRAAE|nr:unnamed protein product [Brassicogethes aeneus]